MAASARSAFSNMPIYSTRADEAYSPNRGTYFYPNTMENLTTGVQYHNLNFDKVDALFNPHFQAGSGTMASGDISTTNGWSLINTTPFGGIGDVHNAFTTTELSISGAPKTSPVPIHSSAGSHMPVFVPAHSPPSDISSPTFPELESPRSESADHRSDGDYTPKYASRTRGRPRHDRTHTDPTNNTLSPHRVRRTSCLPHKQVERKYREGLNMEFERLRRAIPTLPQSVDANIMGASKPSKGMVLGAAIEYINRIEKERDEALDEVERLGGNVRISRRKS
jgi:hypothetical protein